MPPVGSSPFGGWRHHLCHGVKRVTGFSVTQGLPTNPVPLPPLFRGHYGCWAACQFEFMTVTERKPYNRASPEKDKPTALTGDGNAPLLSPVGDVFPGGADLLYAYL